VVSRSDELECVEKMQKIRANIKEIVYRVNIGDYGKENSEIKHEHTFLELDASS
jgi:hypothetical protein